MERGHYYKNFGISPKLLTNQPILIAIKVTHNGKPFIITDLAILLRTAGRNKRTGKWDKFKLHTGNQYHNSIINSHSEDSCYIAATKQKDILYSSISITSNIPATSSQALFKFLLADFALLKFPQQAARNTLAIHFQLRENEFHDFRPSISYVHK